MKMMLLLSLFVLSSKVSAGDQIPVVDIYTAKTLPKLPVLTEGCEGECCGLLKSNKARRAFDLFESPKRPSKKLAVVSKGEVLDSVDFFTKIVKFGSTKVNGKKVIVLMYLSEGNVVIWDGKKVRQTECNGGGDTCSENPKQAETESWLKIKTKSGVTGWADLPAREGSEFDYGWCG